MEAGLRSSSAFTLRRSQIVLASARGEAAPAIARASSVEGDTVRGAIHAFNERGTDALARRSTRPDTLHFVLGPGCEDALKAILHASPRTYDKEASRWTLVRLVECPADPAWTEEIWLRFVRERPVSALTTDFLQRSCDRLEARGKRALFRIRDNAGWHVSHAVRGWIRAHNRAVKMRGRGVRIVVGPLPSRSPWLNAIEPHWMHGERAVAEPDGLLATEEIERRACAYYGCESEPHLALPENAA